MTTRADDETSVACPVCLRTDAMICEVVLDELDPSLRCRCPRCEAQWRVYSLPDRALTPGLRALIYPG